MMENAENAEITADSIMDRLQNEANRAGDPRRIGTLRRLVEACDDILSGEAYKRAKSAKQDPEFFNPNFVNLNSRVIEHYVRFRDRQERGKSEWKGPVATTIRGETDLMTYIKLQAAERKRPGHRKTHSPRTRKVDEIIDGIEGIHDQALMRETIAQGREWKTKLDILLKGLRRIPEISIDALWEGRPQRPTVSGPQSPSAVGPEDAKLLRRLVARFQNNELLDDFELVFRSGRVKMRGGDGLDLIYPAEMKLLERLAELGGEAV